VKALVLAFWIVVAAALFCSAQEKNSPLHNVRNVSPEDQQFIDIEKLLWDAWGKRDRKPYEDLLSDKYFEVDVTGTYDKATEISEMDKCNLKDYALLDPQVTHLNDETVLLTYKLTIHDICEGQPVPEHQTINVLFVGEQGKWLKVLGLLQCPCWFRFGSQLKFNNSR